ncbi:hypothetical protein [Micromonospora sp. NBRC 101691]|uniref:hypothetical protein n=1 Tax=Micromonospora sp. NBRC 101691 TaxID=3032198 RepID=UPI0024A4B6F7|nr:hypothetical protein [Micromonospora sp. NBRC 101691]GLY21688.1 hypothetical protein Misp04_14200 [Micromonospora sp. NBRC 101691]
MTQPAPAPTTAPVGDPPAPTAPPVTPPPVDPPKEDEPLGPAGKKALDEERAARKELERKLAALAPLEQLAQALGGKATGDGKTDLERLTERLTQHETEIAAERAARYRAEVAAAKGLTPQQAARLQGATREELEADADALLALFPAAPAGPRNPVPDPSQGPRGTQPPDLEAQIAAAQAKGDYRAVIALQQSKLANVQR